MEETKKKKMSKGKIVLYIFLGVIILGMVSLITADAEYTDSVKNSILDVSKFYKSNKTDTITPEELIAMKGQPSNIEKWDYEINANTSYPIETYTYGKDNEEYNFYNGKLSYIIIEKKISFKSKSAIGGMFGIDTTKGEKTVDNNLTLRYKNCGVSDFWVQQIENNTFSWVKIKLIDSPF